MSKRKRFVNYDFSELDARESLGEIGREIVNKLYGLNLSIRAKSPHSLWDDEQKNGEVKHIDSRSI